MNASNDSIHKAAVLIRSLPRRDRTRLVGRLAPHERSALAGAISQLRRLEAVDQLTVRDELAARITSRHPRAPHAAAESLDTPSLTKLFLRERPQTCAAILFDLPARAAAQVVAAIPGETRSRVLQHLATMETPSDEVSEILRDFRDDCWGDAEPPAITPGAERLAELLRHVDRETATRWRNQIAESSTQSVSLANDMTLG